MSLIRLDRLISIYLDTEIAIIFFLISINKVIINSWHSFIMVHYILERCQGWMELILVKLNF